MVIEPALKISLYLNLQLAFPVFFFILHQGLKYTKAAEHSPPALLKSLMATTESNASRIIMHCPMELFVSLGQGFAFF